MPSHDPKKGSHNEYGPCVVPNPNGWLVNPGNGTPQEKWEPKKWITKTCTPTYTCQENPAFDFANASFVSTQEQPYPNAPQVNPPIFPLSKNFLKTIVFADNTAVSATADSCEYTCNDGYRLGEGACGGGGGSGSG